MTNRHLEKITGHAGELPDGWSIEPLSKIVRIANGQVLPTDPEYSGLPHIGPENIESSSGRIVGVKTAKELGLISGKYLFDEEALVYAKIRPNLNKVAKPGFKGLCSADAYPIWPKESVSADYLLQFLLSSYFVRQAVAVSMRTGLPKVNREDLNALWIICPPRNEQDEIAEKLSGWDSAVSLVGRLIAAKQEHHKGLMQQLLSGKRRFPGFISSEERIEVRWGSYPADWQYLPIGDIAEQVSGKNRDGSELPVLSCTKHHGLVDSLKYFGKQVFSKDLSTYKIVRRNQFAYATNHIEEGSIGYQDIYDEAVISPMYTVFNTGDDINDRFLYLVLKTELYRHIFEANTSASVDRRGSLRWKEFSKIHVPVPSLDEQRAIVEIFDCCDRELKLLRQQLDAFKEQKKGLMQQLLSGKVRVKPAKEAVA